jgi:fructose-1,6-bisphosphatase/inositol monophosphatase family enzyme
MTEQSERLAFAIDLARRAAELGLEHFRSLDTLTIENKGHQDLVSNADREVETFIRDGTREKPIPTTAFSARSTRRSKDRAVMSGS